MFGRVHDSSRFNRRLFAGELEELTSQANRRSKTVYPQDQPRKHFADLKFLDDGQIAHLTYSMFGTNVEEGQAFMKRAFEAIHSKGSRALILDARENVGGEDVLGELLLSYLVATPFKYYDDIVVNKWKGSFSFEAKYTESSSSTEVCLRKRASGVLC